MAKAKLTDGILCRDKDNKGRIIFFPRLPRDDVVWINRHGWWRWRSSFDIINPSAITFTLAKWRELYDLEPPRKGRCFEAQIEL